MSTGDLTLTDVEWMLSDTHGIRRRDDYLYAETEPMCSIGSSDWGGTPVITLTFIPAMGLPPSPALYRWVAVQAGRRLVGQLSADLNDDGQVDIWFRHTIVDSSLEKEDLCLLVGVLAASADEIAREVTSLFA